MKKLFPYKIFANFFFYLILSFGFLVFTACSSSSENTDRTQEITESIDPEPLDPNREWNLVFEENFDSDLSQWNAWESGAFNNEVQFYRPEQLQLTDGLLSIIIEREDITGDTNPFDTTQKDFEFVSGRIETKSVFGPSAVNGETEYRFMASIQMPPGNGMWPAFWSFGDPWPTQGEIDIIEARGNIPMEFSSNIFFGTQANMPLTNNDNTVVEHEVDVDITADFHTYELIWTANSLEIKFDDETLHRYTANSQNFIASLFGKKQQIVLNTAVGGVFFPNTSPSSYVDSSEMMVDWVRVYKR